MLILVHKAVCLCSRKLEHPEGWVALPDGPKVGDSSNSNQNIIVQLVDDWGIPYHFPKKTWDSDGFWIRVIVFPFSFSPRFLVLALL